MRKILLFISLFFTSILVTTAASCKVISGDGTHIGDEIQCGTENFYVLSNDGENIEMLAKYNLYVGSTYYKVEFEQTFDVYKDADEYWDENYADEFDGYAKMLSNEEKGIYGVLAYKYLEYDEVKQDETAIGAHGDLKVEPLFPEVGVYNYYVVESDSFSKYVYNSKIEYEFYKGGYADINLDIESDDESLMIEYLRGYYDYLKENNIDINDITIISVEKLNELVKSITNEELPLEEWYNNQDNWGYIDFDEYGFEIVGSIKDLMPEGYEWLWLTTYWTRTITTSSWSSDDYTMFFVDTMGDLCNDDFCGASVGAGIRPVVTIPAYLIYQIETKTDGNGTVEADHVEAEGGTEVKFTVAPKEGYVLEEVKVTDSNGNVVTFTDYTFTMPNANVLIEATFIKEKQNPDTLTFVGYLTIGILFISATALIIYSEKLRDIK